VCTKSSSHFSLHANAPPFLTTSTTKFLVAKRTHAFRLVDLHARKGAPLAAAISAHYLPACSTVVLAYEKGEKHAAPSAVLCFLISLPRRRLGVFRCGRTGFWERIAERRGSHAHVHLTARLQHARGLLCVHVRRRHRPWCGLHELRRLLLHVRGRHSPVLLQLQLLLV